MAPDRYGSTENPSQFLPPRTVLPRGPATGPRAILAGEIHHQLRSSSREKTIILLTSFRLELLAHGQTSLIREILIPARAHMDAGRIRAGHIGAPDAVASILETHAGPSQARDAAGVSAADIAATGEATCDVDFLLQRHLAHEASGGGVC